DGHAVQEGPQRAGLNVAGRRWPALEATGPEAGPSGTAGAPPGAKRGLAELAGSGSIRGLFFHMPPGSVDSLLNPRSDNLADPVRGIFTLFFRGAYDVPPILDRPGRRRPRGEGPATAGHLLAGAPRGCPARPALPRVPRALLHRPPRASDPRRRLP